MLDHLAPHRPPTIKNRSARTRRRFERRVDFMHRSSARRMYASAAMMLCTQTISASCSARLWLPLKAYSL